MIIGRSGSGKSTLAFRLGKHLNFPVYHLDKYFFVEGWQEQDKDVFMGIQDQLTRTPRWIIDGNALHTLEIRYARADLILVLNSSLLTCLVRVIKRRFFKDRLIDDRAPYCPEMIQWKLIWYIIEFPYRLRTILSPLTQKYPEKTILYFEDDQSVRDYIRKEFF